MPETAKGDCCCCFPIYQGTLVICGIYIVFSILHMISLFTDAVAIVSGGFSPITKVISGVVGACGVVFGMIGFLGAYDKTPAYLRSFFYFMIFNITVSIVIYGVDMLELHECEAWVSGVQRHVAYNPTMDEIAQRGECAATRVSYSIAWVLDFLISFYFAFIVYRYSRTVDQKGAFSIYFTNDSHPANFTAYGTQETAQQSVSGQPYSMPAALPGYHTDREVRH